MDQAIRHIGKTPGFTENEPSPELRAASTWHGLHPWKASQVAAWNHPRDRVLPAQHCSGEVVVAAGALAQRVDIDMTSLVAREHHARSLVEERLEPDLEAR